MSADKVLAMWNELVAAVAELEKDVKKNAEKHNVSAGIRVRKGLRGLRKQAALLLKETLGADKGTQQSRKEKKAGKAQ